MHLYSSLISLKSSILGHEANSYLFDTEKIEKIVSLHTESKTLEKIKGFRFCMKRTIMLISLFLETLI